MSKPKTVKVTLMCNSPYLVRYDVPLAGVPRIGDTVRFYLDGGPWVRDVTRVIWEEEHQSVEVRLNGA